MRTGSIPASWLPQYTYNDYKKWEGKWELIFGLPYALTPSPLRRHQLIGGRFVTLVNNKLFSQGSTCLCEVLYETDWIIDEHTVIRPDVMIVCDQSSTDFVRTPPVLALEIFSPDSRLKDRTVKFELYQAHGVKYYLLADPDRNTMEIFVLKNNRYEETNRFVFQLTETCAIELDFSGLWK